MAAGGEQVAREAAPTWVWPIAVLTGIAALNAIPHTLAGLLVLSLPTPFSGGPGTLSPPFINAVWGLSNILIAAAGFRLLRPWWAAHSVRRTIACAAFAFALFLAWAIGSLPLPGRFV